MLYKLNQSDIIKKMHTLLCSSKSKLIINSMIKKTFSYILTKAMQFNRIELRGFGVFMLKKHNRRILYNPLTKRMMSTTPYYVLSFKPSSVIVHNLLNNTL